VRRGRVLGVSGTLHPEVARLIRTGHGRSLTERASQRQRTAWIGDPSDPGGSLDSAVPPHRWTLVEKRLDAHFQHQGNVTSVAL